MPFVQIYMMDGRTVEQKKAVIAEITACMCSTLNVPADSVRVWIHDMPATNWGIAGKTAKELGR
jgi:4-oxalocrotonate tautomerase